MADYCPYNEMPEINHISFGVGNISYIQVDEQIQFEKQVKAALEEITISNSHKKEQLRELIYEFRDVFSDNPGLVRD